MKDKIEGPIGFKSRFLADRKTVAAVKMHSCHWRKHYFRLCPGNQCKWGPWCRIEWRAEVTIFRLKRWIRINCQECSSVACLTYCCHHINKKRTTKSQRNIRTNWPPTNCIWLCHKGTMNVCLSFFREACLLFQGCRVTITSVLFIPQLWRKQEKLDIKQRKTFLWATFRNKIVPCEVHLILFVFRLTLSELLILQLTNKLSAHVVNKC